MVKRALASVAVAALVLAGCSAGGDAGDAPPATRDASAEPARVSGQAERKETRPKTAVARRVDPRAGGFEIALGEWAVTPEAPALRPGRVTFLIHNRGTMAHGFEIELEGESSGSGSGDLFKAESEVLQPGESTRMTVDLTMTGIYKIECLVDGHDDMGMEGPLEVRADAPLMKEETKAEGRASGDTVAISNFAFAPKTIEVDAGTRVSWGNEDPAPHTVTSIDDSFDSGIVDEGGTFSFRFANPGTYRYRCNVHPDMEGTVQVR